MSQTFYKVHLPGLSYAELWRTSKNSFEFVIALLLRTLGASGPLGAATACPTHLTRVAPDSIEPELRQMLESKLQEARELGIDDGIWYRLPVIGALTTGGSAFRLPDGSGALVTAMFHITQNGTTIDKKSITSFATELSNGRVVITTLGNRLQDLPPFIKCEFLPRATLSAALNRHQERLSTEEEPIIRIDSEEEIEQFCLRIERAIFEFSVERGALVPVTVAEEAALRAATHATPGNGPTKSAKGVWDMLCWISIFSGIIQLNDGDPNDAQLIFRWSLIGGGIVGLVILATVRHFRRTE
jgi:hypothetical protein